MTSTSTGAHGGVAWIDTLARVVDVSSDVARDGSEAPALYPVLQLRSDLVFPRMVTPLLVGREESLIAVEVAMEQDQVLVALGQRDPTDDEPSVEDFYTVGTEVKILRQLRMPDGSTSILVQGRNGSHPAGGRGRPLPQRGGARRLRNPCRDSAQPPVRAADASGAQMFERCVALSPALGDEAYVAALNANDPGWLADLIAVDAQCRSWRSSRRSSKPLDPLERLQRVTVLLGRRLDLLELEGRIQSRVQEELDKSQREYFLREQLRAIQQRAGRNRRAEHARWLTCATGCKSPTCRRRRAPRPRTSCAGWRPCRPSRLRSAWCAPTSTG